MYSGNMARLVKCLLHNHEDLSLISNMYMKVMVIVICTYGPCAGEAETRRFSRPASQTA